ncbi:hypothetical protein GYMLUDRAFT_46799 [Collybiopsis luxurians FD-317 M1]|uniref:Domain of unknown function at the cortex 1 domain-containing protein n=1 Tax=Collybiopsis luxurians FD-317 M1 TaxID=944289 RepID=A0A0D0CNP7_9AGAR|nr:hypothetical protein GYMLUDRAFT_46799 [Collybiopsis luxurians FD-317 M1]
MPHLQVLCGPDPSNLIPITHLVNTNAPARVVSDVFEGQIIANIKEFNGDCEYFEREDRRGITWSIQVQGRFLQPRSADDIMFGNTFDRPLHLPWGSGAALKFMSYIDPNLTHDLSSPTKPWALSPLIATMPNFAHTHQSSRSPDPRPPPFPSNHSLRDDSSQLYLSFHPHDDDNSIDSPPSSASSSSSSLNSSSSHGSAHSTHSSYSSHSAHSYHSHSSSGSMSAKIKSLSKVSVKPLKRSRRATGTGTAPPLNLTNAAQRRSYFSLQENRENVVFGPKDILTTDFCYGFLEFSPSLTLRLPGGISFDLLRYWDGQPVRFMCCERKKPGDGSSEPWGRSFWCVAIELVD